MSIDKERICIKCGAKNTNIPFKLRKGKEINLCRKCNNKMKTKHPSRKRYESSDKAKLTDRKYKLITKYGLTVEDYNQRVIDQDNKCAICNEIPKRLVIDHDHDTEHVRSLLCDNCNTGIGLLKDSVVVVESALNYLRKHKT